MPHADIVAILNALHFIEQASKIYSTNYILWKMIARHNWFMEKWSSENDAITSNSVQIHK